MSSNNRVNIYTSEFKESAVRMAIESKHPIAQTARDLGVNVNTLHRHRQVNLSRLEYSPI